MTKNEIKKELYKQKPQAILIGRNDNKLVYTSFLFYKTDKEKLITFNVPESEGKEFDTIIKAQLLIRWLVQLLYIVGVMCFRSLHIKTL